MSLFGGGGGTSAAPTFSFGSAAAPAASTSTSTAAPSLFGQQPAAGGGGGLFGAPKPATTTSAPSLFGSAPAPAPAQGGGLFGTTTTTAGAPKPTFSFGGGGGGGGGLFGSSAAPSTTAAPGLGGGGLFGSQPQQQQQGGGGGLFGSTTTGTTGTGTGLFGGGASSAAAGTSSFAPTAATSAGPTAAAAAAAGTGGGISKNTKFNDLPDAARNAVEEIDKFIRGQCQLADQLKAKDLGGEVAHTQRLYEQYSAEASTVTSALQTDARLLSTLRAELEQSLNDLTKTTLLIEGYKAGPQSPKHQEAKLNAGNFPYEYFRRKADEMKDRVKRYRSTMDQIASLLSSPSHSLSPAALVPTLKAQHASLVSLASAVSALDLELKQLKDEYRTIWREKTGRVVDPFRINGGGASGVGIERNLRGIEIR
ncbi:Charged multivesicular body protein 3 [Rhodotorula mucilaginosa]|uniref:Charged multivesicular body protein 3 n=1 Tax=Rhodotorula mucilaginosa TaxID=5537 RepID=A0A9P6VUG9_RHOMI|nr:Charged multivesicular body protein 3 [Rhodotorula mucilaginosa]